MLKHQTSHPLAEVRASNKQNRTKITNLFPQPVGLVGKLQLLINA